MTDSFPARTILLGLLLAGCAGDGATAVDHGLGQRLAVVTPGTGGTVLATSFASIPAQDRVIRDSNAWQSLWTEAFRQQQPVPQTPAVDFSRDMVLLVAIGSRPSGGYAVSIDSVVQYQGGLVVEATERMPGRSCITTAVLTSPAVGIRVPIATGEIRFRRQQRAVEC